MAATWANRTDTVSIPIVDGQVVGGVDPHHRPVAARYRHPSRWQRIARSEFAGHLRASARGAFYPTAIGSGWLVGLVLLNIARSIGLSL